MGFIYYFYTKKKSSEAYKEIIETLMNTNKRPIWLEYLLIFLIPILGMAMGVGTTFLFGISQTDYSNLVVNLFLLISGVFLLRFFQFSKEDVGLGIIPSQMKMHTFLSLAVFILYLFFYIFAIRISILKPFSAATLWGLLTYLVVVFAEELYFRGILYAFIQKRFSERAALVVSSVVFGLFHAQQGLRGILSKMRTGWLWGSIRYSTGMIFLIIVPVHFAYNSIWLLFEGNWNNPPQWSMYALPVIEFLLGCVILFYANRRNQGEKNAQPS